MDYRRLCVRLGRLHGAGQLVLTELIYVTMQVLGIHLLWDQVLSDRACCNVTMVYLAG